MTGPRDWLPGEADFPAPEPMPKPAPGEPDEDFLERFNDWNWRAWAWSAVLDKDPAQRAQAAEILVRALREDTALAPPLRNWLLFVTGTLLRTERLPYLYRGRDEDRRARGHLLMTIGRRFLELRDAQPRRAKVDIIATIAAEVGKSESTIEKLMKRPGFKDLLDFLRWEREQAGTGAIPPPP